MCSNFRNRITKHFILGMENDERSSCENPLLPSNGISWNFGGVGAYSDVRQITRETRALIATSNPDLFLPESHSLNKGPNLARRWDAKMGSACFASPRLGGRSTLQTPIRFPPRPMGQNDVPSRTWRIRHRSPLASSHIQTGDRCRVCGDSGPMAFIGNGFVW